MPVQFKQENRFSREPLNRYCVAEFGALLAEPARAAILIALLDGSARPANELGRQSGVSQSTASAHLHKLCEGQLLKVLPRGRHRFYRLANEEVALVVESLSGIFRRSQNAFQRPRFNQDLLRARTCFGHLAGRLGLRIFSRMNDCGALVLDNYGVRLSNGGRVSLIKHGFMNEEQTIDDCPGRLCINWPERQFHLSGALGTQLMVRSIEMGWVRPVADTRALRISPKGLAGFQALGLERDELL